MTEQEILKVMSDAKKQMELESRLSRANCYEDMRERKVREMCVFYPAIGTLSAGKFIELWDKAA